MCRALLRAETNQGTLTLRQSKLCAHTLIFLYIYINYVLWPLLNIRDPSCLVNYVSITAFSPDLRRVYVHSAIGFLHHSTITEVLSLSNLIKGPYPSVRIPQRCCEVIVNDVAVVACKFMIVRHGGQYIQSRRPMITVIAARPRT